MQKFTILLDLDGPILDCRVRHYACYYDVVTAAGLEPIPLEDYWNRKRQRSSGSVFPRPSGAEALLLQCWVKSVELPAYLALDKLQDGASGVLRAWHDCGFRIIIATLRRNPAAVAQQLRDLALARFVDDLVVTDPRGGGKGKADAILEKFPDLSARNCVWIGDTEADAIAGQTVGCPVYLVTCGIRSEAFLRALGVGKVVRDLVSIAEKVKALAT